VQTIETTHLPKREKKALEFFTRASKKRSLATLKTEIGNADPNSDRADKLRQEHTAACAALKRRRKAVSAVPTNP
jgi:hypothetical protein